MNNKNLLTYGGKVFSVIQSYFAPIVVVPPTYVSLGSMYCVLARPDNWTDDNNPSTPTQDQIAIKKFQNSIFVAKKIEVNNTQPVVQRNNWTSGTVYDYYRDDVDMFAKNISGTYALTFYVKNVYDQVFKCLWNNNGAASTKEPFFEPGIFNENNLYLGSDGYKWKYLYTIDSGLKVSFMDDNWMPVPTILYSPNPLTYDAGGGSIDVINVVYGGSGYDPANSTISVVTTGDGDSIAATAVVTNHVLTDILVTTPGKNYTYANTTLSTAIGSGAILHTATSPVGGHGKYIASELGCSHIMISTEFNGSESGIIPTDITYHQIGLVLDPVTLDSSPLSANASIYSATTDLVVSPGFGTYTTDEIVYQGTNYSTASFIGTVLSFDSSNNLLRLISLKGTPSPNFSIYGITSGTTRTLLSSNPPSYVSLSGYVSYIENRSGVQRSPDGIEQVKIVLGF